jgi:hypothetical protein
VTVQKLTAPTLPAGALCLTVCVDHCEPRRAAAGSCGLFHFAGRLPAFLQDGPNSKMTRELKEMNDEDDLRAL